MNNNNEYEYAGFWVRVGATLVDTLLILLITSPIGYALYGDAYFTGESLQEIPTLKILMEWVFPLIASVIFWVYKSATPGKMAFSLKILDEHTGEPISTGQAFGRYVGYFVSIIPVMLGLIWVAFDSKKQGFHDKLASTVVVKDKRGNVQPVSFKG